MIRPGILFLCTGNSCRSQMAEAWLRHLADDRCESLSAGARPAGFVHRLAIEAMAEVDIDLSGHSSKSIDDFVPPRGTAPDVVISVCDAAECPTFPGPVERRQWNFDDPAAATGTRDEQLAIFRRVRDGIRAKIEELLSEPTGLLHHGDTGRMKS